MNQEHDQLKERLEEVELELEILKNEINEGGKKHYHLLSIPFTYFFLFVFCFHFNKYYYKHKGIELIKQVIALTSTDKFAREGFFNIECQLNEALFVMIEKLYLDTRKKSHFQE